MLIPSRLDGYARDGRRLYFLDGGGGDSGPTQQTVTQTNVPEYARPYVESIMGRAQALGDINSNPYQQYGGPRVAGPSGLQDQSYQLAGNLKPAAQLGQASALATQSANQAGQVGQYTPGTFTAGVNPLQVGMTAQAPQVGTQQWNSQAADQYMSPYMRAVMDIQKREAIRDSNIIGQQENAQAVGQGAFGGSRHAIVQAERERNLGQRLGDIEATGLQAAYDRAGQMFTSDQGRMLQAGTANQGATLAARGQNLQGQMANQDAGLQFNQQGLMAQQLGEQSRQFGNQAGLAGLQARLQAAGLLGDLGQSQYNQQIGIAGLQNQFGTQQRDIEQQRYDTAYQDFVNRNMYPMRMLEFENNIIRGNYSPNTTTSVYGGYGTPMSQIAGLGTAAAGISRLMAKGGEVKYAEGGEVIDVEAREVPAGLADLLISQIK